MRYFDTHAHYWDSRLAGGAGGPDADPATLFAGSVCAIVNVGTDPQTCRAAITQAARYTHMYTALGIHPSDCQHLTEARADVLDDLRTLLTAPASKAVALGEIGLDYHYPDTNRDIQQAYLHDQLELARSLGRASREFKNARDGIVDDLIREPRENAETVKTSGEECRESGKPLDQGK